MDRVKSEWNIIDKTFLPQLLTSLSNGNSTLEEEAYFVPKNTEVDVIAKVLAAEVVSSNFAFTQTTGSFLGNFMPLMFNDTIDRGFSGYSAEACHESVHGEGTCSRFQSRDFNCRGDSDPRNIYIKGYESNV